MKKVNIFTILAIISAVCLVIMPGSISKTLTGFTSVCLIVSLVEVALSIASIVYAKKIEKSKAPGIILLIIGIIATLIFIVLSTVFSIATNPSKNGELCKATVNCTKGKNTSTCYMDGDNNKAFPIKCKNENLTDNQFK